MILSSNELDFVILQQGEKGIDADEKYIWVKYSQYPDGRDLTDNPYEAKYIGVAYNKLHKTESNNPKDYAWTLIKGEDAYTIFTENDTATFAVEYFENTASDNQSVQCDIGVAKRTDVGLDFTIGEIESDENIDIEVDGHSVILSVKKGHFFTQNRGTIKIPIHIDEMIFYKSITWNTVKNGMPALNVILENEAQNIPCTSDGITLQEMLIEIPFTGYFGTKRYSCTATVGELPKGMTLGINRPDSVEESGLITINVREGVNLEGANEGKIALEFLIKDTKVVKRFTWVKTLKGDDGVMTYYEITPSPAILTRELDESMSVSTVVFNATKRFTQNPSPTPYKGYFVVSETKNGGTYEHMLSTQKASDILNYTISSDDILAVRCYLYEDIKQKQLLDIITIPVLSNEKSRKTVFDIKKSIKDVDSKVDKVNQQIVDRIWQSDIDSTIDVYNDEITKVVRDRFTEEDQRLDSIKTTIADVTTTVKTNTGKLGNVDSKILEINKTTDGITSEVKNIKNHAGEIESHITELKQTDKELLARIDNSDQKNTELKATMEGISTRVSENNQYINETQRTAKEYYANIVDLTDKKYHKLMMDIDEIHTEISDVDKKISAELSLKADEISGQIKDEVGDRLTSFHANTLEYYRSLRQKVSANEEIISNIKQKTNELEVSIVNTRGKQTEIIANIDGIHTKIEDDRGRISKAERNIASVQSEFKDKTGRVSIVEQNLDYLRSLLSTANGNISEVNQTIDTINTKLATNDGRLSMLRQELGQIETKVVSSDKSISSIYQDTENIKLTLSRTQDSIPTQIRIAKNEILASAERTSIRITNDKISNLVTRGEMSSRLEQTYKDFWFKFNNNGAIKMDSNGISFYNGSGRRYSDKTVELRDNGYHFYRNGTYLGKMGTNSAEGYDYEKGIVFDIDPDTYYMSWSAKSNSDDTVYTIKLLYANKSVHFANGDMYEADTFHMSAPLNMHWNNIKKVRDIDCCDIDCNCINSLFIDCKSINIEEGINYSQQFQIPTIIDKNTGVVEQWQPLHLQFKNGILVGIT